ncbi:hypothetical protein ACFE04_005632 [Oxalis oulophora]
MTTSQSPPYDIIIIKAAGANSVWFIRNGVVVVQGMRLGGAVICILESTKLRFEEMEAQLINRSFNVGLRPNSKLPNVILQSTSKANVEEPPELVFLLEQESEVYHFTPTEKLKRPPVAFPKNRDSGLFPITKSFNVQIGFGANIRDKTITWKGKFSSPKDMHSGADNVSLILAITRCISDCVGLIISFSLFHTVKLQRRGLDREVALLICSGSSWWLTDLGHNKVFQC